MTTVTKSTLAGVLFTRIGLNKREAGEFVERFFGQIKKSLGDGEAVKLSGFGNFDLIKKSARPGRNPRTGEPVAITPRTVVTFRPSAKLKSRVAAAQSETPPPQKKES
ncbi:MAG: integration host factor subunit alpha [Gammaproteobacteria bacterium]|nr:integration host factor subunit alpha [Gammaproteobacteria bacterium]MDD9799989.1 integration host factor subunit alpha [Gammaproteobacteria bacterium]MDD9815080.1 integration host factor subunit alpha [Gammaproteobacteria bacterium]MDD9852324.1 integration host factor subunit alpha [Gammaproteobacteria bacterium]MDD9870006.1 integration host factor subunit alpha [Gammaproteobacteria bacterium]